MSHAAGVGAPFPREVVRAMLLLRANTLALGHSGCRPLIVDRLLGVPRGRDPPGRARAGQRRRVRRPRAAGPPRPARSSAAGEVEVGGQVVPALLALREAGLEPLTLGAKEGLALLNGTQMMGAHRAPCSWPMPIGSSGRRASPPRMSVEALLGTDVAFAAAYQLARPHPGQVAVAAELRHLLRDSGLQRAHHGSTHKVQDPYSLRCVPQVHGAVRDALDHLRRVLDIELNSATDNPLVFPGGGVADADTIATGGGRVISGGNFHGEPIALALDFAKLALAELGSISERRTALLVDARLNGGLPPFLAPASGVESGDDDLPVHGRGPASRAQGPGPSGIGRLDPDVGQPGGPRLDGLDLGAPRPRGPRGCRADRGDRAARRRPGPRPAAGRDGPAARWR